ncbi:hypothetical protein AYO38_00595 [bacterium SCGC AG-212-C10]|nr:hypothetical protein AYO38_00595 [bacterium SCGC AG-212-C10]
MGTTLIRASLALVAIMAAASVAFYFGNGRVFACGSAGPFDFDTYEVESYVNAYNTAIELAATGQAITTTTTLSNGEVVDVRYQGLKSGPRTARIAENKSIRIPPSIYKAIVWIETGSFNNASKSVYYGGVGPVIRSPDCGYGLGQITTGMSNSTGKATAKQAIVGSHYLYNLAEGARILADKWDSAPKFRPIAGTGNPAALEDWYFAIWSYNGFAFSNHPLNPDLDPLRGGAAPSPIYHCQDTTAQSYQAAGGIPKFGYNDYTYPERVYGCMRNPPTPVPQPGGVATKLAKPQTFLMPDFSNEVIAKAFDVKNFLTCEDAGFSGGCPLMDYPTTIPAKGVTTHTDSTPAVNPALAAQILGAPRLAISGPTAANFTISSGGTVNSVTVTVANNGSSIGPYVVRASSPWIIVRHPGEPASRTIDGGVALGKEMSVVVGAGLRQSGYSSTLQVTVNPSAIPKGTTTGKLTIEPLLGGGAPYTMDITVTGTGSGGPAYDHRQLIGGLSSDRK